MKRNGGLLIFPPSRGFFHDARIQNTTPASSACTMGATVQIAAQLGDLRRGLGNLIGLPN